MIQLCIKIKKDLTMSITRADIVCATKDKLSIPDNINPKLYRPNIAEYGNEHTIEGRKEKLHMLQKCYKNH